MFGFKTRTSLVTYGYTRGNTVRAVNVDMLATDDGEKSIIVNRPSNNHCKLSITSSDKLISLRHGQA